MEETKPAVSRRGLLRRAGTVAAGVGVVGVATASPAQAAEGPINIDVENLGDATTTLTAGTGNRAALKLSNASTGAPLELDPVEFVDPGLVPPGSTYTDSWGDVHVTGTSGDVKFDNMLYSPTWATMVFPVPTFRLVDTRGGTSGQYDPNHGYGRYYLSNATYSGDRLMPKNGGAGVPDALINLQDFLLWADPVNTALQANITAANAAAAGFLSLYSGAFQGTSNLNYSPALYAIANFTQTPVDITRTVNVKIQAPVVLIVDVVGYVLADWISQMGPGGSAHGPSAARSGAPGTASTQRKREATPRRR